MEIEFQPGCLVPPTDPFYAASWSSSSGTSAWSLPAKDCNVTLTVTPSTSGLSVGQLLYCAGHRFQVVAISNSTTITVQNLGEQRVTERQELHDVVDYDS